MISGKQLKQILDYSFTGGTSFTIPSVTFISTPSDYPYDNVPGAVTLSGVITPNDGLNISWTITEGVATLASGTSNNVSHNLVTIPTTIGTKTYNLNVNYSDGVNNYSITATTSLVVTASGLIGQIDNPVTDIVVPGDLTGPIEAALISKSQTEVINLFEIVAADTGRLLIVVPYSFGTLTDIQDNTDLTALDQFNVVDDPTNSRKIYVSILAVTPATYNFKLVF